MIIERIIYRIKQIRLSKKITQDKVAEQINMSQNNYSRIESGSNKLTVDTLLKISAAINVSAINVSVNDLLSDEPIKIEI